MKAVRAGLDQTGDHDQRDRGHEQVGGGGEGGGGIAHPAQVAGDQQHDHHQADRDSRRSDRRDRRGHRGHASGDRHGDREDVVDDQPRSREQAPLRPQAVARNDVRATAVRIGSDHLAVAEADREHQHRQRRSDRQRELQLAGAGEHEDRHHRLGAVGHRGERVGRKDGEREQPPHALLGDRRAAQRRTNQHTAQRVRHPARQRIALPRPDCRFELVVFRRLSPRASDVDEAPRARALRIGEIEPWIDRQRALPDLPRRHAPIPAAAHVTQRDKRALIKLRQLCARRDSRVGSAAPSSAEPDAARGGSGSPSCSGERAPRPSTGGFGVSAIRSAKTASSRASQTAVAPRHAGIEDGA